MELLRYRSAFHPAPKGSGLSCFINIVIGVNENGTGVAGESDTGYGGSFTGGVAPLILGPSSASGPPNGGTHKMGELYVDANGVLYFCTASGTPGTWFCIFKNKHILILRSATTGDNDIMAAECHSLLWQ